MSLDEGTLTPGSCDIYVHSNPDIWKAPFESRKEKALNTLPLSPMNDVTVLEPAVLTPNHQLCHPGQGTLKYATGFEWRMQNNYYYLFFNVH